LGCIADGFVFEVDSTEGCGPGSFALIVFVSLSTGPTMDKKTGRTAIPTLHPNVTMAKKEMKTV